MFTAQAWRSSRTIVEVWSFEFFETSWVQFYHTCFHKIWRRSRLVFQSRREVNSFLGAFCPGGTRRAGFGRTITEFSILVKVLFKKWDPEVGLAFPADSDTPCLSYFVVPLSMTNLPEEQEVEKIPFHDTIRLFQTLLPFWAQYLQNLSPSLDLAGIFTASRFCRTTNSSMPSGLLSYIACDFTDWKAL